MKENKVFFEFFQHFFAIFICLRKYMPYICNKVADGQPIEAYLKGSARDKQPNQLYL
jgi:hypothetical protein